MYSLLRVIRGVGNNERRFRKLFLGLPRPHTMVLDQEILQPLELHQTGFAGQGQMGPSTTGAMDGICTAFPPSIAPSVFDKKNIPGRESQASKNFQSPR